MKYVRAALALGLLSITADAGLSHNCRSRECFRARADSSALTGFETNCACTQVQSLVVVRGRTESSESGRVDLCSKTGTFATANAGDFVSCGPNVPRVMNGAAFVEPTGSPTLRINYLLNATQFDSADWVKIGVVSAAPVVVADQAASPLGTMTADQVTFDPTTLGVGLSVLVKSTGSGSVGRCPAVAHASGQVMIRGTTLDGGTTSGTLDLGVYDGTNWHSVACPYTGSTFTRCKNEDVNTTSSTNGDFYIGNAGLLTGTTRPAQTVFLALAGCEEGLNASTPIDATNTLSNGQVWTRMPDIITANGGIRTAWLGDSLSANTVASTASTQVYPRAPERYATRSSRTVDNWAVNGATLLTDMPNQWANWGARTGAQRIVVWGGINDIVVGAIPGHTVWTNHLTFINAQLAQGRALILVNLSPFKGYAGWSAGLETEKDNFNSDMATYCTSVSGGPPAGVTCIDMDAALRDSINTDELAAANAASDKLHLSQTGATLAGDTVYAGAP